MDYGYNSAGCYGAGNHRQIEANQVEVTGYDGKQWIYDDVPADEHQCFIKWANEAFASITNAAFIRVVGKHPYYAIEVTEEVNEDGPVW